MTLSSLFSWKPLSISGTLHTVGGRDSSNTSIYWLLNSQFPWFQLFCWQSYVLCLDLTISWVYTEPQAVCGYWWRHATAVNCKQEQIISALEFMTVQKGIQTPTLSYHLPSFIILTARKSEASTIFSFRIQVYWLKKPYGPSVPWVTLNVRKLVSYSRFLFPLITLTYEGGK